MSIRPMDWPPATGMSQSCDSDVRYWIKLFSILYLQGDQLLAYFPADIVERIRSNADPTRSLYLVAMIGNLGEICTFNPSLCRSHERLADLLKQALK